ncbi:SRPBCC family protein [Sphaerotilaceae bacterium SBD11-9]
MSSSPTADREIVITRWLDAPRELVFAAWTDPAHVGQWWGPAGFTNTVSEMDVRPGGVWRLTMHGPDGVDYPNRIVFSEVAPPAFLAYRHGSDESMSDAFDVTVTFEAHGARTLLVLRSLFATAEARERVVRDFGAIEGGQQMVDRLSGYLLETEPARDIVSLRVFNTTPAALYAAFTDPQRLARWWGPKGFRNTFETFEPRPGGEWRFVMHGPDGKDYKNYSVFTELTPSARIVFEHRCAPYFEMAIGLLDRGDGSTLLTWRQRFDRAETRAAVAPIVVGANEENFDRLAAELQLPSTQTTRLP